MLRGGFGRQVSTEALFDCGAGQPYPLYKGEQVDYWPFAAGHDPNTFSNPWEFDPNRFSTTEAIPTDDQGNPYSYHFGVGKHRCPGENYARKEIKVVLAYLLARYHFETTQATINLNVDRVLGSDEPIMLTLRVRS